MINAIYIGIGGFIGAASRYLLVKYLAGLFPSFPVGTLAVNVLGSFILGVIVFSVSPERLSPELRELIIIGILGGFTTMSTFAYDSFTMLELDNYAMFALNVALNVILSVGAVYAGKELAQLIIK